MEQESTRALWMEKYVPTEVFRQSETKNMVIQVLYHRILNHFMIKFNSFFYFFSAIFYFFLQFYPFLPWTLHFFVFSLSSPYFCDFRIRFFHFQLTSNPWDDLQSRIPIYSAIAWIFEKMDFSLSVCPAYSTAPVLCIITTHHASCVL